MKKKLLFVFVCCFAVAALTLTFGGLGAAGVAYAAEAEPLVVGGIYTMTDSGGTYTVTIISETEYSLHAVENESSDVFDYFGSYTYIDGKLTLIALGETLGVFTISGTTLTEIIESEIVEPVEPETPPTFTDRMNDWFGDNLSEFLSGISVAISGVFMSIILPYLKRKLTSVNTTVLTNSSSQEAVVNVVNQLIVKYNDVEAKLAELDGKEISRDALQAQFGICQKAILEILTTVYNNSKNIPQATKDLINLQYVKVLKTENDTAEVLKENGGE